MLVDRLQNPYIPLRSVGYATETTEKEKAARRECSLHVVAGVRHLASRRDIDPFVLVRLIGPTAVCRRPKSDSYQQHATHFRRVGQYVVISG